MRAGWRDILRAIGWGIMGFWARLGVRFWGVSCRISIRISRTMAAIIAAMGVIMGRAGVAGVGSGKMGVRKIGVFGGVMLSRNIKME